MNAIQYKIFGSLVLAVLVTFAFMDSQPLQSRPVDAVSSRVSSEPTRTDPVYAEPLIAPIEFLAATETASNEGQVASPAATHTPTAAAVTLLRHAKGRFEHDERATFHPHGESVCASGCAASRHPTPKLTPARYRQLMEQYASPIKSIRDTALNELLFHGPQSVDFLNRYEVHDLSDTLAEQLRVQLRLTHARIAIRVTDENGRSRAVLEPTRVPLDRRHVFDLATDGLQPMVASGTFKRVGFDRVWTRL